MRGIAVAEVTTAVPLDDSSRAQLAARLTRYVGQQIEMETSVDPAIMGGVVVRVGDLLLDGSVRGRLEALRRRLAATGSV
jgi:F-type H+-transporting ATPase subunit delta